jgi:hypothetical protein
LARAEGEALRAVVIGAEAAAGFEVRTWADDVMGRKNDGVCGARGKIKPGFVALTNDDMTTRTIDD